MAVSVGRERERERRGGRSIKLLTSQVKVRLGIKRKIDKEKGRRN